MQDKPLGSHLGGVPPGPDQGPDPGIGPGGAHGVLQDFVVCLGFGHPFRMLGSNCLAQNCQEFNYLLAVEGCPFGVTFGFPPAPEGLDPVAAGHRGQVLGVDLPEMGVGSEMVHGSPQFVAGHLLESLGDEALRPAVQTVSGSLQGAVDTARVQGGGVAEALPALSPPFRRRVRRFHGGGHLVVPAAVGT